MLSIVLAKFYIGNISRSASEDVLKSYLEGSGVEVVYVRWYYRPNRDSAAAHIVIGKEYENDVLGANFWPENIIIKRWIPRNDSRTQTNTRYNGYHD